MKIKELYSDSSHWTQGSYARDSNDNKVNIKDATKLCLAGALLKCYPDIVERMYISNILKNEIRDSIVYFNDHSTFEEIKALVEKLDV